MSLTSLNVTKLHVTGLECIKILPVQLNFYLKSMLLKWQST